MELLDDGQVKSDRLLTFTMLQTLKGWPFSRMHTDRLEKAGKFPIRVRPAGGRIVAWWESEVDALLASLPRGAGEPVARHRQDGGINGAG